MNTFGTFGRSDANNQPRSSFFGGNNTNTTEQAQLKLNNNTNQLEQVNTLGGNMPTNNAQWATFSLPPCQTPRSSTLSSSTTVSGLGTISLSPTPRPAEINNGATLDANDPILPLASKYLGNGMSISSSTADTNTGQQIANTSPPPLMEHVFGRVEKIEEKKFWIGSSSRFLLISLLRGAADNRHQECVHIIVPMHARSFYNFMRINVGDVKIGGGGSLQQILLKEIVEKETAKLMASQKEDFVKFLQQHLIGKYLECVCAVTQSGRQLCQLTAVSDFTFDYC